MIKVIHVYSGMGGKVFLKLKVLKVSKMLGYMDVH